MLNCSTVTTKNKQNKTKNKGTVTTAICTITPYSVLTG